MYLFVSTPAIARKHLSPIPFHIDNDPVVFFRHVQHLVERADVALAVVGTLAFGVGVVNE